MITALDAAYKRLCPIFLPTTIFRMWKDPSYHDTGPRHQEKPHRPRDGRRHGVGDRNPA